MRDLSALQPDLVTTFKVVNRLLNTLAYNPPGAKDEGFLFWASWVNHLGPAVFSNQDAQGPIRRGLVVIGCQSLQVLENIVSGNPQLGTLVQLLEAPDRADVCPQTAQTPGAGALQTGAG
jgi:phospholipid/cholesterol/gamma-HCH transport system substrate-binding protein